MQVLPAVEAPWPAVERVFDADGGDPSTCSCQWFRFGGPAFEALTDGQRREQLRAECTGPAPGPGLVALQGGEAVGWCGVGPLAGYPRMGRSPLLHGTSPPEWTVTCFIVPARHRRQGIARTLLAAAVEHARAAGARSLGAVQVDTAARPAATAAELYHGPLALFLDAGFAEVARPSPARAVVRLDL